MNVQLPKLDIGCSTGHARLGRVAAISQTDYEEGGDAMTRSSISMVSASPKERIIVALDNLVMYEEQESLGRPTATIVDLPATCQNLKQLIDQLSSHVGMFKVGLELFTALGPDAVEYIAELGGKVFLDLKFHDIPNTVGQATRAAAGLGVEFIDVHTLGGLEMMKAAVANKGSAKLLGITILTSHTDEWCRWQFGCSIQHKVLALAFEAKSAGLEGIVCAPTDVAILRSDPRLQEMIIVTPGIRPAGSELNDQNRVAAPGAAILAGADYLVIGRPITADRDPVAAAQRIAEEIEQALAEQLKEAR